MISRSLKKCRALDSKETNQFLTNWRIPMLQEVLLIHPRSQVLWSLWRPWKSTEQRFWPRRGCSPDTIRLLMKPVRCIKLERLKMRIKMLTKRDKRELVRNPSHRLRKVFFATVRVLIKSTKDLTTKHSPLIWKIVFPATSRVKKCSKSNLWQRSEKTHHLLISKMPEQLEIMKPILQPLDPRRKREISSPVPLVTHSRLWVKMVASMATVITISKLLNNWRLIQTINLTKRVSKILFHQCRKLNKKWTLTSQLMSRKAACSKKSTNKIGWTIPSKISNSRKNKMGSSSRMSKKMAKTEVDEPVIMTRCRFSL